MIPRQVFSHVLPGLLLLLVVPLSATARQEAPAVSHGPDKVVVVDGRSVHDVGQLWHHVTNWGLLGSGYTVPTTFSDSPSCMWPGGSGDEYLWAAGLWVGGLKLGERLVSTGGWATEWRPTEAVGDTIVRTAIAAPGGARYPAPDFDDDGDGLEDEDIPNGLDDDGDGLVDEDFAAYGDQHFICTYRDNEVAAMEQMPDHTPLDVEVVQQSIQWSLPGFGDFVGFDFTVTNIGVITLEQLYVGMFADHDIGPRALSGVAQDDRVGFASEVVSLPGGLEVPVQVAFMFDGATSPVPGHVGWVLLDHTTDPTGATAPAEVAVRSFQRFSGQAAFEQGGDPTNDDQRYELLSLGPDDWDSDSLPGQVNDYRLLTSTGPYATLAPGESLHYKVALVMGGDREEMLANAARARLAYNGLAFDRDGDPANGQEYQAHWLLSHEMEVAADAGYTPDARLLVPLSVSPNPFNPRVNIQLELPRAGRVVLEAFDARGHRVRTLLSGSVEAGSRTVVWPGDDDSGRDLPSGVYTLRLVAGGELTARRVTLLR